MAHKLKRGDHVCALYSTSQELALIVAEFLVDGLRRGQRCWFITAGDEIGAVRAELAKRGVNTADETDRGALALIAGGDTYQLHGAFDPERTIENFNNAIEKAIADGFTGFRAAAEMSWALDHPDGFDRVIEYEALLRSLFSSARAIGLCLYNRARMPLNVIDGALATHPIVRSAGQYRVNQFYDESTTSVPARDDVAVLAKLATLEG